MPIRPVHVSCLVALLWLLALAARAETDLTPRRLATGLSPDSPPPASTAERARASALARQAIDFIDQHNYPQAEAKLREALAIVPDKAVWVYNLACLEAVNGKIDDCFKSLDLAAEDGFTDFAQIERDPAFNRVRGDARYKRLLARKAEITHNAAQRAIAEMESRFGKGYIYDVDEEHKLIFATNTDRQTLDALKETLMAQARSQWEALFVAKPDEFIRIVLPSAADYGKLVTRKFVAGMYEDETRTLLAQRLGQVMTHEFTHALHAADQRAVGQEHPVWLREGLASMYEASEYENGTLVPHDNFRLAFVQNAVRRQSIWPLEKLLKFSTQEFISNPNLAYGESSSLLLYLYEKQLLRKFYDEYKADYPTDRTGQSALEKVTGMKLPELQKAWQQWMLTRTPPSMRAKPGGASLGVQFASGNDGLRVRLVLPHSPAAKSGIKPGDVIVGVDDRDVRDYQSMLPLLDSHKPGDEITLKLRRAGEYMSVAVVLGQR